MSQPCDKHVAASADDSDSDSDSRFPCHNCVEMTYGLEMKTNNISHFGYNLRSAITNCEIMVIDYNKRLRERSPEAGPSLPMVQLDKDASSSSSVDTATSKEVDIFSEHNEELADYIRQMNYRRSRNSEKQTFGSWLIISYVNGGWDYDTVKNYLLEEINCQSHTTCPIRIPMARGLVS
ncbi:uncharacterized protein LOC124543352 [Vanessa cardui]|uniref:uncharacterized protein LOC124543352 n=1 Tax=Vanessa cardui TaxID=171605 RepID=UPI001F13A95C|nr:uncharacterized protein LOC124543352 [Vanessa cardui]